MDSAQLEEYRKRMQARHQGRSPPVQPSNAPIAPIAPNRPSESEDERIARELQAEENARVRYATSDEEYARKLQSESERVPESVPPPRNIQREERLVDPYPPPMGYYYNPPPAGPEAARPLLPMNQGVAPVRNPGVVQPATSCFPETEKCCGVSSQRVVLALAGAAAVAILVALVVLVAES